jgi:hypothetical protein
MPLPDNLDDAQLREHLDAIPVHRLLSYLENLDPEDQARVNRLLANSVAPPRYENDFGEHLHGVFSFRAENNGLAVWNGRELVATLNPSPVTYLAGEEGSIWFEHGAYVRAQLSDADG